jgi:site-specific recombinase XerD
MENTNSIKVLSTQLCELIKSEAYTASTVTAMKSALNRLSSYMARNNLVEYTPEVGERFVAYRISKHVCSSLISRTKSVTKKLNNLLQGLDGKAALLPNNSKKHDLPEELCEALDAYLAHCADEGNRQRTIHAKYLVCGRFLKNLSDFGCNEMQAVSGEEVQKAFLAMGYVRYWERIGRFLSFLFSNKFLKADYSEMIKNRRGPIPQPTVYSTEEIKRVEESCDLSSPAGIRNYAIILLMTRYGIRTRDVEALTFSDIDFENNRLNFLQQKTGEPWESELLPIVKTSLKNYIDKVRPSLDDYPNVFITLNPPYVPADQSAINVMVRNQFQCAGVDTTGRRYGSRALRSSLASNMINDGISTEIVRRTLGHGTKHALKHYARIDVESMRLCHLPVPQPSGNFAAILSGKGGSVNA